MKKIKPVSLIEFVQNRLQKEIDKQCRPEHYTYATKGHVICSICGECITCEVRKCRNGGEHTK